MKIIAVLCIVIAAAVSTTIAVAAGGKAAGATRGALVAAASPGLKVWNIAGCGNCHTFKAAHSTGHVGPNLDLLKLSLKRITKQVKNGGGAMPAFKNVLTTTQINTVAKFVYDATHKKKKK